MLLLLISFCTTLHTTAFSSIASRTLRRPTAIIQRTKCIDNPRRDLLSTLLKTAAFHVAAPPVAYDMYPLPSQHFNVSLSPYEDLMRLSVGGYHASESFSATALDGSVHSFRILIYPRGGGSTAKNKPVHGGETDRDETSGFGMSYKVLPMFGSRQERVGVYLQYLPKNDNSTIDATFDIRLKGHQTCGRIFDVEWSAGMRFVKKGKLSEGTASDFGAHLMQTSLLERFMGAEDGSDKPLRVHVRLTLHPQCINEYSSNQEDTIKDYQPQGFPFTDIRRYDNSRNTHDVTEVRVGKIVVPILQKLSQRPLMFEVGAYPGVEYRILRIFSKHGYEVFGSEPGAEYELKPIYPLVDQLERQWPVRVREEAIPKLLTANMYNIVSALGSLFTAVFGLFSAFALSQLISLFVIPSRSMDPTLRVGDVLLVEKVTPRILKGNNHKGDVVLFHPPSRLQNIVSASGGHITDRDLFVKRVAAEPGDIVTVDAPGNVKVEGESKRKRRDLCEAEPLKLIEKYVKPGRIEIQKNEVFVAGDCGSVSIDSRVWGSLSTDEIVGKPLIRVWPLDRFGRLATLPNALSVTDRKK